MFVRLFVMLGCFKCPQLGLGHVNNCFVPVAIPLDPLLYPIGVVSGPLSRQSLIWAVSYAERPSPSVMQASVVGLSRLDRCSLPSLTLSIIKSLVSAAVSAINVQQQQQQQRLSAASISSDASKTLPAVVALRTSIDAAFSSISVLNASFSLSDLAISSTNVLLLSSSNASSSPSTVEHSKLTVDLHSVRQAYNEIMSLEHKVAAGSSIVATLGRATLHLSEQLKDCLWDDAENLAVFLITLENPLMLRAKDFHVAIERVSY
jgi:hypothetical protein